MCRALSSLESWSSSSMPSITGGLNGAPAGRFLDVSGWVGVLLVGIELGYGFGGSCGLSPQSIPR